MNETVWLFDLDNTLHNADAGIFYLINRRMTEYLAGRLTGTATAPRWPDCKSTILKSMSATFCANPTPLMKF